MNVFRSMRREIGHGGIVPPGWELAWYEPAHRLGVYYPAPLHWVLRILREIRYRVQIAMDAPGIERAQVFQMQRTHRERMRLAEEYSHGYMQGWRECFQACLEVVEGEIAGAHDEIEVGEWLPIAPKPPRSN